MSDFQYKPIQSIDDVLSIKFHTPEFLDDFHYSYAVTFDYEALRESLIEKFQEWIKEPNPAIRELRSPGVKLQSIYSHLDHMYQTQVVEDDLPWLPDYVIVFEAGRLQYSLGFLVNRFPGELLTLSWLIADWEKLERSITNNEPPNESNTDEEEPVESRPQSSKRFANWDYAQRYYALYYLGIIEAMREVGTTEKARHILLEMTLGCSEDVAKKLLIKYYAPLDKLLKDENRKQKIEDSLRSYGLKRGT